MDTPEIAVSGQILANDTVNLLVDARNLTLSREKRLNPEAYGVKQDGGSLQRVRGR